jgi:hypothetical protein
MVVGINTFNGKNSNGTFPRLVFQVQNIPLKHRMNPGSINKGDYPSNAGSYKASEGRVYLAGNFSGETTLTKLRLCTNVKP